MKIKAKLTLGVGLLFALIILLAFVSIQQVYTLAQDTKNILTANYNSLEHSRNMLDALEKIISKEEDMNLFEAHLIEQEQNITEVGEAEMTQSLRLHFNQFKTNLGDSVVVKKIRAEVNDLMKVNLEAIQRKSAVAENTANNAEFWIGLIGAFCFLIAFTLLFNLPANIADPVKELTESITQIAAGDYTQRVHFKSSSEFGELADSFNVMAKKLEAFNASSLAKLITEKRRIDTLINKMHDPVIGLDEDKKVLFANEEALKITGLKPEEVIGKSALELSVNNDLIRSLMQDVIADKKESPSVSQPPMKIYADGKESYFEKEVLDISVTPTGEKTPRHIGHVILLRNVTAYKELDSAKSNFIATISHEFKTPISSIKMSLQLLENGRIGAVNEEQKNLLHSIHEDAERLLKITGELLDMAQVETGNIQLTVLSSDAKEIISQAMEANRNASEQKKIRLELHCPDHLPHVLADSDKTTWVMTNLISNAIRYSYDNSVVQLYVNAFEGHIEFAVKDTGQGIQPQYVHKVFDRYFRVPGTTSEGTGLGLAISKEFIEAQGGKITVESDFGAGSTFKVSLNISL
ncbi:MAG: PAS domain-containing protein [Phycisphaerae bacterium]|nr:PAS domain-containing protein [Saprospiraceae bacterium]